MKLAEFQRVPLVKRKPFICPETGDLFALEVRRDPTTGLTLAANVPYAQRSPAHVSRRRTESHPHAQRAP